MVAKNNYSSSPATMSIVKTHKFNSNNNKISTTALLTANEEKARSLEFINETKTQERKMKKRVSFGDIQMRHYSQTVGDHPCTPRGPPISLDWQYKENETIPLDEYESQVQGKRKRRSLIMSDSRRRQILTQQYGYGLDDINAAIVERIKTARQREQSAKTTPVMKLEKTLKNVRLNSKKLLQVRIFAQSA
mmetsp:Transcript_2359/g.3428  ORF Transcript_2359/g.3428 Transcript_2359/m.3428 type:complete len:191 (-) Transcript_2359:1124-1696(-)